MSFDLDERELKLPDFTSPAKDSPECLQGGSLAHILIDGGIRDLLDLIIQIL